VGMSYVVMQARFKATKATESYTIPNRTREHELKLEYLKTRLGLSGLPLPLLILNHGRRKGAYQNNIPQTLDPTPVM
jgi:hypothetical protein